MPAAGGAEDAVTRSATRALAVLIGSLLFSGLAPLAAADDEAGFPGFTLAAPAGEAWRQVQRNASSIVWMKRQADPRGSFSAAVLTGAAPTRFEDRTAFVAYVRRSKTLNPDPRRYVLVLEGFEPVTEPASFCVRYVTAITDGSAFAPSRPPLEMRVTGLACLHPQRRDRYFDVQYSSRGPRGIEPGAEDVADGEAFLGGFAFGPPPPDDRWSLGSGAATPRSRERT